MTIPGRYRCVKIRLTGENGAGSLNPIFAKHDQSANFVWVLFAKLQVFALQDHLESISLIQPAIHN